MVYNRRMTKTKKSSGIVWIAFALIVCIVFGTVGVIVKTAQRTAANSPQLQIAEDAAAQLKARQSSSLPTANLDPYVDMAKSLAPFVVIYDNLGDPLDGTGYLNGKLPTIPYDVLTHATINNPHAITWQPQPGVREAAVVALSPMGNYVLASRSLKEVERQENLTYKMTFIGMGAALAVLGVTYFVIRRRS